MTCSSLYLGTGRFGTPPLPPDYANSAILFSSYSLTVNVPVFGTLTTNNHGTDDSPSSLIELFWSDPTTGFQALSSRLITSVPSAIVPGATLLGGGGQQDGEFAQNFAWTPDNTVLGTNGGHVCLLARVSNNVAPPSPCTQQSYNSSSPATDPPSAIHNVQIVTASGGGGGGGRRMAFAFAATNTLRDLDDTKLDVRVLDPVKDRHKLEHLVAQPVIDRTLARRGLKFAVPKEVHLVEGRERVIVDPRSRQAHVGCVARIGKLGPVDPAVAAHLTAPGAKPLPIKGPVDLRLVHGESRQMILSVDSNGGEAEAYGVEVGHLGADGRNIGGLLFVFVSPHHYF